MPRQQLASIQRQLATLPSNRRHLRIMSSAAIATAATLAPAITLRKGEAGWTDHPNGTWGQV